MRKRYLFLATVGFLASSASCLAVADESEVRHRDKLNLSFKKLGTQMSAEDLLKKISERDAHGVKSLSLKGQEAVDDAFIKTLVTSGGADRLINADLSGTNISSGTLSILLGSRTAGTWRDRPQYSGRFGMPSSTLYLDVSKANVTNDDKEDFSNKVATDVVLRYGTFRPIGTSGSAQQSKTERPLPQSFLDLVKNTFPAFRVSTGSLGGPEGPKSVTPASSAGATGFTETHQVSDAVKWLEFKAQ